MVATGMAEDGNMKVIRDEKYPSLKKNAKNKKIGRVAVNACHLGNKVKRGGKKKRINKRD